MVTINSLCELNKIIEGEKIIVYGVGRVGKALISFLLNNGISKEDIKLVVSDKKKANLDGFIIHDYMDDSLDWGNSLTIIAMMEPACYQVEKIVCEKTNKYCLISNDICLSLRHMVGDYEFEITTLTLQNDDLRTKINDLSSRILRLSPQKRLSYLVLNILDHCNLNCKGCDHFSPIAKERFCNTETVIRDLYRLSDIMKSGIERIGIMGGEPLLHPGLIEIVYNARKAFRDSRIQVDTNGILLEEMPDEFWTCLRDNDVEIVQTKYPIKLNFEKIETICKDKGVQHLYYGNTEDVVKTSYKIPFDIKGEQDINNSFSKCFHANYCVTLMDGKIYPCTVAPNAHIFNEKYKEKLEITQEDYIDIYNENINEKRILDFISTPIPFCRFCDVDSRTFLHEWSTSKGEKTEWMLSEKEKMPYQEERIRQPRKELKFEVHLTEHCNLNCKGCFHFSSIAEESFLDVNDYTKVIERLSFLYKGKMEKIILLGGEPLLHPEIERIIDVTREMFSEGILSIVTNGILLPKMDAHFWECCRRNDVLIEPTKYPLDIKYDSIEQTAKSYGVKMHFFNSGGIEKTLTKQTMDIYGQQSKEGNFYGCYRANECITLKGHRLYTCIIPAHIHHFSKRYDLNLPNFENDGIDVFTSSAEEISSFLTKPIEACRYCDRANMQSNIVWETSRFEKSEWLV